MQTKFGSFLEAFVNVAIGYWVATIANYYVLPLWYEGVTFAHSMSIGLVFTGISMIRSYVVRRWFNARIHRLLSQ